MTSINNQPNNKVHRFGPGNSGRPKGALNKTTRRAQKLCMEIVEDPDYQKALLKRMQDGTEHESIVRMVWDRACGKVPERITVAVDDDAPDNRPDLGELTDDEVAARAIDIAKAFTTRRTEEERAAREAREAEQLASSETKGVM